MCLRRHSLSTQRHTVGQPSVDWHRRHLRSDDRRLLRAHRHRQLWHDRGCRLRPLGPRGSPMAVVAACAEVSAVVPQIDELVRWLHEGTSASAVAAESQLKNRAEKLYALPSGEPTRAAANACVALTRRPARPTCRRCCARGRDAMSTARFVEHERHTPTRAACRHVGMSDQRRCCVLRQEIQRRRGQPVAARARGMGSAERKGICATGGLSVGRGSSASLLRPTKSNFRVRHHRTWASWESPRANGADEFLFRRVRGFRGLPWAGRASGCGGTRTIRPAGD